MSKAKAVVGQLSETGRHFDIEWEIPDFMSLSAKPGEWYDSPLYPFGDTSWCIRVYPNGQWDSCSDAEKYAAIYVRRWDSGPPVTTTFSLFLRTEKGRENVVVELERTFKGNDDAWGYPIVLKKQSELVGRALAFMNSGALRIVCTLKFNEGRRKVESSEIEQHAETEPEKKFVCDYRQLLLSGDGCDVTLLVKGQKFQAHRIILAARSPVFASMLRHDANEKNTGLIDIEDCDSAHFPDFLLFLYCGTVDNITSQNACSLYRAADKYDVQDLKTESLSFIKSHLDVDNFCDVIAVAWQLNDTDLVSQATDFFAESMLKIIVTAKWQEFLAQNPAQSNELTIKALSAKKISNP